LTDVKPKVGTFGTGGRQEGIQNLPRPGRNSGGKKRQAKHEHKGSSMTAKFQYQAHRRWLNWQRAFIKPEKTNNARHYAVAFLGDMTRRPTAISFTHSYTN
jgi:hypothetical protein